jgi:hypothetical protein
MSISPPYPEKQRTDVLVNVRPVTAETPLSILCGSCSENRPSLVKKAGGESLSQ